MPKVTPIIAKKAPAVNVQSVVAEVVVLVAAILTIFSSLFPLTNNILVNATINIIHTNNFLVAMMDWLKNVVTT